MNDDYLTLVELDYELDDIVFETEDFNLLMKPLENRCSFVLTQDEIRFIEGFRSMKNKKRRSLILDLLEEKDEGW